MGLNLIFFQIHIVLGEFVQINNLTFKNGLVWLICKKDLGSGYVTDCLSTITSTYPIQSRKRGILHVPSAIVLSGRTQEESLRCGICPTEHDSPSPRSDGPSHGPEDPGHGDPGMWWCWYCDRSNCLGGFMSSVMVFICFHIFFSFSNSIIILLLFVMFVLFAC